MASEFPASRPRNARFARSLAACALHTLSQAPSVCAPPSLLKPFFFHWFCCHHLSVGLELFQPGLQGGYKSAHVVFLLKKTTQRLKNWSFAWKNCLFLLKKTSQRHKKLKFFMNKSIQPLRLRFGKTQQWKGNPLKDIGLNTPIPSRNALENMSLNRNGISGSPLT